MIGCPVFLSLLLIFFGVLLLLENLGIGDGLIGKYWPAILIILGIASLFNVFRLRVWFNRFRGRWPPDVDGK